MDPGTGSDAVAGIGGSLIPLWFLTLVLLVLLLTAAFAATPQTLVLA